jgi:hypothetical protein
MTILISSTTPAHIEFAKCGPKISPALQIDSGTGLVIDLGQGPNINETTTAPNQRWVKGGTTTLSYVNAAGTAVWSATSASVVTTTGAQPIKGVQWNAAGTEFYICYMHPTTAAATFDIVKFTAATGASVTTQFTPGASFVFGGTSNHTQCVLTHFDEGADELFVTTSTSNGGDDQFRMWRIDLTGVAVFNDPSPVPVQLPGFMSGDLNDHFWYASKDNSFQAFLGMSSSNAQSTQLCVVSTSGSYRFTTDFPPAVGTVTFLSSEALALTLTTFEIRMFQLGGDNYYYQICMDRDAFDAEIKSKLFSAYGVTV